MPKKRPTPSEVRRALEELLRAYDEFMDTDVLDPLAAAVGNARVVLGGGTQNGDSDG